MTVLTRYKHDLSSEQPCAEDILCSNEKYKNIRDQNVFYLCGSCNSLETSLALKSRGKDDRGSHCNLSVIFPPFLIFRLRSQHGGRGICLIRQMQVFISSLLFSTNCKYYLEEIIFVSHQQINSTICRFFPDSHTKETFLTVCSRKPTTAIFFEVFRLSRLLL